MTTRVVDYSPLLVTPTPHEVAAYRAQARAAGAPWAKTQVSTIVVIVSLVIMGVIVGAPIVGGILAFLADGVRTGRPVAIPFLLAFVLGLALVGFAIVRVARSAGGRWGRWLRMDRFARANGFVFSPADPNPGYPGMIFNLGNSRQTVESFRTDDGRFLHFGNFRYTTGSGKHRATHLWGFLALRLDRRLPHMVLDARANNRLFGASNLPTGYNKDQVLSLEGDFNEYFRLYCPVEYERDALYVFTPDLMALLIDHAAPFDVEVVDDWMFAYSAKPFPSADPAVYQRLLRIVDTVGAKTLRQTHRYQDDRVGAPFEANIVARAGTRLKRRVSVGAIIMIVIAILIWSWSFLSGMAGVSGG